MLLNYSRLLTCTGTSVVVGAVVRRTIVLIIMVLISIVNVTVTNVASGRTCF